MNRKELTEELNELCDLYQDLNDYICTRSANRRAEKWKTKRDKLIEKILYSSHENKRESNE